MENHLQDHFLGSQVELKLPKSSSNSVDSLIHRPSQISHLYIGPPKIRIRDYVMVNSDSTCIQLANFLVRGMKDLEYLAQQEVDKLSNNEKYWLVIHADSTTAQATIDSVKILLEPKEVINGFYVSRYNYELDRLEYEVLE